MRLVRQRKIALAVGLCTVLLLSIFGGPYLPGVYQLYRLQSQPKLLAEMACKERNSASQGTSSASSGREGSDSLSIPGFTSRCCGWIKPCKSTRQGSPRRRSACSGERSRAGMPASCGDELPPSSRLGGFFGFETVTTLLRRIELDTR